MRIMLGVKMSLQLGRLKTLTSQHFVANQTRCGAFIVFRYESEIILQKTFIIRSLFGMTSLVFLIELPLFLSASQCCICLCRCFNIICSRLTSVIVRFFLTSYPLIRSFFKYLATTSSSAHFYGVNNRSDESKKLCMQLCHVIRMRKSPCTVN